MDIFDLGWPGAFVAAAVYFVVFPDSKFACLLFIAIGLLLYLDVALLPVPATANHYLSVADKPARDGDHLSATKSPEQDRFRIGSPRWHTNGRPFWADQRLYRLQPPTRPPPLDCQLQPNSPSSCDESSPRSGIAPAEKRNRSLGRISKPVASIRKTAYHRVVPARRSSRREQSPPMTIASPSLSRAVRSVALAAPTPSNNDEPTSGSSTREQTSPPAPSSALTVEVTPLEVDTTASVEPEARQSSRPVVLRAPAPPQSSAPSYGHSAMRAGSLKMIGVTSILKNSRVDVPVARRTEAKKVHFELATDKNEAPLDNNQADEAIKGDDRPDEPVMLQQSELEPVEQMTGVEETTTDGDRVVMSGSSDDSGMYHVVAEDSTPMLDVVHAQEVPAPERGDTMEGLEAIAVSAPPPPSFDMEMSDSPPLDEDLFSAIPTSTSVFTFNLTASSSQQHLLPAQDEYGAMLARLNSDPSSMQQEDEIMSVDMDNSPPTDTQTPMIVDEDSHSQPSSPGTQPPAKQNVPCTSNALSRPLVNLPGLFPTPVIEQKIVEKPTADEHKHTPSPPVSEEVTMEGTNTEEEQIQQNLASVHSTMSSILRPRCDVLERASEPSKKKTLEMLWKQLNTINEAEWLPELCVSYMDDVVTFIKAKPEKWSALMAGDDGLEAYENMAEMVQFSRKLYGKNMPKGAGHPVPWLFSFIKPCYLVMKKLEPIHG